MILKHPLVITANSRMNDLADNPEATNPILPIPIGSKVTATALVVNDRFFTLEGQKLNFAIERFDLPSLPESYPNHATCDTDDERTTERLTELHHVTCAYRRAILLYEASKDETARVLKRREVAATTIENRAVPRAPDRKERKPEVRRIARTATETRSKWQAWRGTIAAVRT